MTSINITDFNKLDDCKQKIDNLLTYYEKNEKYKSKINDILIKSASQSLKVNLEDEYIVINYLILAMLKVNTIKNSENILNSVQLGISAFHCLFQLPELKLNNSLKINKNIINDYDQSIVQLLILTNLTESFNCILNNKVDDINQHNKIVIFILKRYSIINKKLQQVLIKNVLSVCSKKDTFCLQDISFIKRNIFNYFLKYIIEITYIYSKQEIQDLSVQKILNKLGDIFTKLYNTVYLLECDDMNISSITDKLQYAELLECNFKLLKMDFIETIKSLKIYNELFDKILVIMEKNLLENIRIEFRQSLE